MRAHVHSILYKVVAKPLLPTSSLINPPKRHNAYAIALFCHFNRMTMCSNSLTRSALDARGIIVGDASMPP
jgi:hypothetical protein